MGVVEMRSVIKTPMTTVCPNRGDGLRDLRRLRSSHGGGPVTERSEGIEDTAPVVTPSDEGGLVIVPLFVLSPYCEVNHAVAESDERPRRDLHPVTR